MERTTSKSPWIEPKPLSMAQMPTRISRGTPDVRSIWGKLGIAAAFWRPRFARPSVTVPLI
jgi:hypothetical protein